MLHSSRPPRPQGQRFPPFEKLSAFFQTRRDRIRERLADPTTRRGTQLALVAGAGLALFLCYWVYLVAGLPSPREMRGIRHVEATVLFTADGKELSAYSDKNRTWVPLDSIAPVVVEALVATEDHRFRQHSGIDVRRLVSSTGRSLAGDPQGGSTITMQLARNAFTELQDNFVLTRKFREWLLALSIEGMYEKDEILEMYLNTVPFMYNAFGVEAAARTYFGKQAYQLELLEAATLVGMLKATVFYNPVRHPERSLARRNVVLSQMAKWGYLPADTLAVLEEQPTKLTFNRLSRDDYYLAPHFADAVRQDLDEWAEENGYNLYRDGLRIYTTIDSRLQQAAEEAVQQEGEALEKVAAREWGGQPGEPYEVLWSRRESALDPYLRQQDAFRALVAQGVTPAEALDSLRSSPVADSLRLQLQRVEAGFVAIEPGTGAVRAWVGGRRYGAKQFDHVREAKRQPGSTFKPFVYGAALEAGRSPYERLPDVVAEYRDPDTGQRWRPANSGGASGAYLTLADALAYSKNTITARLITEVGPKKVVDFAQRLGIESELNPVPSLGLGTSEVTLLEMVGAYAAIADGGRYHKPHFISRIESADGQVLAAFEHEAPRQAITPEIAYTLVDMMRGVVQKGTGQRVRSYAKGDLAGKTGTTQNGADGWFMLVHPTLAVGAWVGFDTPLITFRSSYYGQGAHTALPIVGRFMRQAQQTAPELVSPDAQFTPPPGYTLPAPPPAPVDTTDTGYVDLDLPDSLRLDDVYESLEVDTTGQSGQNADDRGSDSRNRREPPENRRESEQRERNQDRRQEQRQERQNDRRDERQERRETRPRRGTPPDTTGVLGALPGQVPG